VIARGRSLAALAWLATAVSPVLAQPALDRLTIVAPAAPGGGWDQTARALQHVIEADRLVPVVEVQNVPGAAGTIGLAQFINTERGNGRALLVSGLVMLGATLWNDSPVAVTQATPIARLTGEYEVVAVPASSPHRDLRSLIEAFRQRPEAFAWGGGSAGGTDHILAGLLADAAGIDPRRVNYIAFSGGGEAVAALLGGHVTAGISGYSEFAPHIESGRLRAIAVSSPVRIAGVDVPTAKEGGFDVELVNWRAVLAAAGISPDDRARLTSVVRQATESARWKQILADRQWTDAYLDGGAFEEDLRAERTRVVRIVARLRRADPGRGTTAPVGQRIVPVAVLAGGLSVLIALIVRARARRSIERGPASNWQAAVGVCCGLAAFAALLTFAGFIIAATVLFAATVVAFSQGNRGSSNVRKADGVRFLIVAVLFSSLVYLTFTRGLDLLLPAGSLWSWMR
jgi:putative tricarboxylic transport membrane protein